MVYSSFAYPKERLLMTDVMFCDNPVMNVTPMFDTTPKLAIEIAEILHEEHGDAICAAQFHETEGLMVFISGMDGPSSAWHFASTDHNVVNQILTTLGFRSLDGLNEFGVTPTGKYYLCFPK